MKKCKKNTRHLARKLAREQGLKRYYTGSPCNKGHLADRYVSNAMCVECLYVSHSKRLLKPKPKKATMLCERMFFQITPKLKFDIRKAAKEFNISKSKLIRKYVIEGIARDQLS